MPSTRSSLTAERLLVLGVSVLLVTTLFAGPAYAQSDERSAPSVDTSRYGTRCVQPSVMETPTARRGATPPASVPVVNETDDRRVPLGDVAAVPLSVPAGANVSVSVGADRTDSTALAIRDDGDGQVVLVVNTYLAAHAGTDAGTYRVRGNDTVTVTNWSRAPLQPGDYAVRATQTGTAVAERSLRVTTPEIGGITVQRAAPQVFESATVADVRAANRSGLLRSGTESHSIPTVTEGETAVLRIDAPSIVGAVAAANGTTTDRVLSLRADDIELEIFGPCGGILLRESATERGSVRALVDAGNGTLYLLLDTARLEGVLAAEQTLDLEIEETSVIANRDVEAEQSFEVADASLSVDGVRAETVDVQAGNWTTISGRTAIMPGSRFGISLVSRQDPTVSRRATATVHANGTFQTTLDTRSLSSPGLYDLTVFHRQYRSGAGDPPSIWWDAHPGYRGETTTTVYLDDVSLPKGGFLVAYEYDETRDAFHPVGTATEMDDFELPRTVDDHVLVVAHRDGDDDGRFDGPVTDPAYRLSGHPVQAWTATVESVSTPVPNVSFAGPESAVDGRSTSTATVTESPTAVTRTPNTPTAAVRTTDSSTGAVTTGDRQTGATGVGFGPVVTLLALVVAALLARRR
ncbi:PGF-CTERM sorting domain-containing protein [Haloarcula pellucida]|uniref:PGF-CTERM archaeal protein-sorting signal domain-containing protein n=1 Tax=Haloarcula pellucida TaxID=1427151 RepID=A0A830GUT1_9EURY|nr:PGF-CTERM sorting domain-containing protein [Halomicroarcula pellucida]GGO03397.1 hypothetical protein GCM10009030_38980 [Halomicroarcula pellucida]